ncbi:ribosomal protein S18-alanine N-acetyltransferase [Leptothermofonsia sp. ETS-13]|uniref:ribosomal protein S18-alanine N-acetyltransferase n=1 Tax=Leptothermofonsia sp. ETS-13 TaxID=3035696 RepID=UPI003BA15EBC
MTFLSLQPLTEDLLPAAIELDQRCFGGLWTLDGYRRELDSPNSALLVLRAGKEFVATQGRRGNTAPSSHPSLTTNNQPPTIPPPHPPAAPSLLPPLLGIGCYWAILEEAHITLLGIAPEYQRQGLGQTLFYALLRSAYLQGLEQATLEVRISNQSALSLYQKFGFREAGHRKKYYQDTGEDALVLWQGGLQSPAFLQNLQDWQETIRDRLHTSGWQLDQDWDRAIVKKLGLTQ